MKERPILFSGPMVRALLSGTKTQTRRMFSPRMFKLMAAAAEIGEVSDFLNAPRLAPNDLSYIEGFCPYGAPGDRLWVRESHRFAGGESAEYTYGLKGRSGVRYLADGEDGVDRWRPSIHMHRWASRISLEITAVRVERLQEISESDARAEGVSALSYNVGLNDRGSCEILTGTGGFRPPQVGDFLGEGWLVTTVEGQKYSQNYRNLWAEINGPDSWESNPWVWVIEFRRVKP